MRTYAILDAEGYPVSGGAHPGTLPPGAVELPKGIPLAALRSWRVVDGALVPRPTVTACQETAEGLTHADLPAGTLLRVVDLGTGEVLAEVPETTGSAVVVLPADGEYRVEILPPRPWLGREQRVMRGAGSSALAAARLDKLKTGAIAAINAAIGEARGHHFTDIAGQQMLYLEKRAEALAYVALDPEPASLAAFPLIAAEVGITAPTAWQLAQLWLNMAANLITIAAALETLRMSHVYAVGAAPDAAGVAAERAAFQAALQALEVP